MSSQPTPTSAEQTAVQTPQIVDNMSTYNNLYDEANIANQQAESTGRTRAYLTLGASKVVYGSMTRLTVMKIVSQWSASADVLALGAIEIDMDAIPEGSTMVTKWRGKPVFVRHRPQSEVDQMKAEDKLDYRDPETDAERTNPANEKFLVVIGICTHLGCVPVDGLGDYGGWFCPCHGSHYDRSGRIRKGPAPLNLEVPDPWVILPDGKTIKLG
jgi:ubiquinol-cytochrome c reductase iron-sulfur subunit